MSIKNEVYKLLINSEDYLSGEKIATSLATSRMSVCNAIKKLEQEGLEIASITNKGYKIISGDILNDETLVCNINSIYIDECTTTMAEARAHLDKGEKTPFVVVTSKQTAGRGRRGRTFISDEGGIYLTLVVENDFEVETITTKVCVAVSRVIDSLGFNSKIKWVNDIYIEDKKCVGILTEGIINLELQQVSHVLIGIGINYTTSEFPEELNAISLFPDKNIKKTRSEFISQLIDEIFIILNSDDYFNEYREKSCIIGKKINVIKMDQTRKAKAIDIDSKCHLIVEYEDSSREVLSSGDVSIRNDK